MKRKKKPTAKAPKKKEGRPLFDGKPEAMVLAKLEEVWAIGGSDAEAAFFADISASSLCRYLERHPKVSQRKEALKNRPILLARKAVTGAFDGHVTDTVEITDKKGRKKTVETRAPVNPAIAMDFLKKRKADEFGESLSLRHSGEIGTGNELGRQIAGNAAASAAAADMVQALSTAKVKPDGADPTP